MHVSSQTWGVVSRVNCISLPCQYADGPPIMHSSNGQAG